MKKKLIPLLVLSTLCFGVLTTTLLGCEGPVGPAGPQGPQGQPGEPGEDGKTPSVEINADGYWVINGVATNVKANGTDGEDGKTPTIEISPDGFWVINGEKTDVKVNGTDGEDGPQGDKGDTAWSNTILPAANGYVTVNKGSAIVGDTVTFTLYPNNDYGINKLFVNDTDVTSELKFNAEKLSYEYTGTMVTGGFVVKTTFEKLAVSEETIFFDGKPYIGTKTDIFGNVFFKGSVVENLPTFSGGSGTKEDPLLITKAEEFTKESLTNSKEEYFKLENDLTIESLPKIETAEIDNTYIDLGGNTLSLTPKKLPVMSTILTNGDSLVVANGTINAANTRNAALFGVGDSGKLISGGSLTLDTVTVNTVTGLADGGVVIGGKDSTLNIINSTINSAGMAVSTNANNPETTNVVINIENSNISANGNSNNRDNVALLVNVPSKVNVKGSTITGSRQAVVIRSGSAVIEDSTIEYSREYYNNPTDSIPGPLYGEEWGDGNRVATAAVVVGDTKEESYIGSQELTLKNVTYKDVTPAAKLRKAIPEMPYKLYINGESATYKATVNLDKKTYENFGDRTFTNEYGLVNVTEDLEFTRSEGRFIDGVWYDAPYLNKEGTPLAGISTPSFTKFEDGEGTEKDPLIVSSTEQLQQISTLKATGNVYFKLKEGAHLYVTETIKVKEGLHVILDLNGGIVDIEASKKSGLRNPANETKYVQILFSVSGEFTLNDSTATEENKAGNGAILAGRTAFSFETNAKGTFNAGTVTDISETGGSAIYAGKGTNLTINYVEVYATNFTLGFGGDNLLIKDGLFNCVSNSKLHTTSASWTYAMSLESGVQVIEKMSLYGIHGGLAARGGKTILKDGVNIVTDVTTTSELYKKAFAKFNQTPAFTEEQFASITVNFVHYPITVMDYTGPVEVIVEGGTYTSADKACAYVFNCYADYEHNEAELTIKGGTFNVNSAAWSAIYVDNLSTSEPAPTFRRSKVVFEGGKFTDNDKTEETLLEFLKDTEHTYANLDGYYVVIPKSILG